MSILQSPVCMHVQSTKPLGCFTFMLLAAEVWMQGSLLSIPFPYPCPHHHRQDFVCKAAAKQKYLWCSLLQAPRLCARLTFGVHRRKSSLPHQGLTKLKIKKKFVYLHTHLQREKSPSANGSFNLVVSSISRDLRREKEHLAALPCKINL